MSRLSWAALTALLVSLLGIAPALALKPVMPPPKVEAATPTPRAIDATDLAAYTDGIVDGYMRRLGIAGVTVAVVDTQGPLLLRGYGIASQGAPGGSGERKVDPERTLFRIGSVSKTFTYLEALKLIDAGKIKLDAPINDYLPADLKLSDDGYKPMLVRHLLTHTAGYEDSAFGHLFAKTAKDALTLNDYVKRHRPARVREPDTHAVYSNYSLALLGAALANVSGMSFEQLIERDLFAPMGMHLTTLREPLLTSDPRNASVQFKGLWSDGFSRSGGGYSKHGFEYISQVAPAGAVSSNAVDMGRYLRMLINHGQLDGVQVMPTAAFAKLEGEPLFRNAPDATGFSYGFFRKRYGEVESLEHGGATLYFHSNLVAVPELGIGIFISTNTDNGAKLAAELPRLLLERYFPRARAGVLPAPPKDFAKTGAIYAGSYLGERRSFRSFEKVLLSTSATVGITNDGYLTVSSGGDTSRWVLEKPHVFRAVESSGHLTFLTDKAGRVTGFVSPGGHDVLDRVGVFDQANTLYLLLGLAAVTALGVFVGAWLRRNKPRDDKSTAARSARWLYATAAVWLLFAIVLGVAVMQMAGMGSEMIFSYPGTLLTIALWLAVLVLLLTALCVPLLWSVLRARDWGFWRKARHTLAVLVFALAGYAMWTWNVVGWKV